MATLSGQTIANTFDSLLHVEDDTAGLVATATDSRVIQDGVGANSALALATDSVRITSTNKLYFNDVGGEYISGSGSVLSIVGGSEIDLTATAVDLNGTLDVSGNTQLSGTVTVSADETGKDVIFYSGTAGANFTWDASEECLIITGTDAAQSLKVADGDLVVVDKIYLYDNDGGEYIHGSSDGHLEVNSGTTLDMTAPTVDINASTAVTVDGPAVTIADGTGSKPLIIVKNTANDTTGSELRFVMDKGSAGADGDDLGTISFYGDDAGQNQTAFAKIVAEVSEADETDEAGKLSFYVAESDGTDTALTAGLILEGEHATDGEVDVTIGAGASSTTTTAGDLTVTGDLDVGASAVPLGVSGCVVQVTTVASSNEHTSTSNAFDTDACLSDPIGSITTKVANSKILIIFNFGMCSTAQYCFMSFRRGGAPATTNNIVGSTEGAYVHHTATQIGGTCTFLDSPAQAAGTSIDYTPQIRNGDDSTTVYCGSSEITQTMTLLEIV